MDEEMESELREAVGAARSDQVAAGLRDLADVLGSFVERLHSNRFSWVEAREMAREWYTMHLWVGVGGCDHEEDDD